MVKMRCMRCSFLFEVKESSKHIFCQNCGEKEKIIKEQSAEELIIES